MTELPAIETRHLGVQAFVHRRPPTPSEYDEPTNTNDLMCKPDGGLWTSTLRSDGTTAWGEWCRAEDFAGGDYPLWRLWLRDGTRVYQIHSEQDLADLLGIYQRTDEVARAYPVSSFAKIDFESMRADGWDGIHLTDTGQRETRFTRPGLYGWDCESTLWLRWVVRDFDRLGTVALGREDASNAKVSDDEHENDDEVSEAR